MQCTSCTADLSAHSSLGGHPSRMYADNPKGLIDRHGPSSLHVDNQKLGSQVTAVSVT